MSMSPFALDGFVRDGVLRNRRNPFARELSRKTQNPLFPIAPQLPEQHADDADPIQTHWWSSAIPKVKATCPASVPPVCEARDNAALPLAPGLWFCLSCWMERRQPSCSR